jgi:hypothetical protein
MEDEQESTRGWIQSDISRELRKKWVLNRESERQRHSKRVQVRAGNAILQFARSQLGWTNETGHSGKPSPQKKRPTI